MEAALRNLFKHSKHPKTKYPLSIIYLESLVSQIFF